MKLEEVAKKYANNKRTIFVNEEYFIDDYEALKEAVLFGANLQKEEMMKGAICGKVHHFCDDDIASVHYIDPHKNEMALYIPTKGFKTGDKVKLIIIKDE